MGQSRTFGNVSVLQQLVELLWKGSRAGRFGLLGPPPEKARKEEEIVEYIGGMRGLAMAVKLLPGLRRVGRRSQPSSSPLSSCTRERGRWRTTSARRTSRARGRCWS